MIGLVMMWSIVIEVEGLVSAGVDHVARNLHDGFHLVLHELCLVGALQFMQHVGQGAQCLLGHQGYVVNEALNSHPFVFRRVAHGIIEEHFELLKAQRAGLFVRGAGIVGCRFPFLLNIIWEAVRRLHSGVLY